MPRLVLIAEDNAELRQWLKIGLESAGFRVIEASNGAEAVALQRESPAEVLLTDLFMPDSDGFEAIDAFRRAFPATRIVAMSGDAHRARREYLDDALLIGVDATLRKPFRLEALLRVL